VESNASGSSQINGGSLANGDYDPDEIRNQAWDITALMTRLHPDKNPHLVNWG
jgi:hypothetical protein